MLARVMCVIHRRRSISSGPVVRDIQQRLAWGELYEQTGDAGFTCRRGEIARSTLRKVVVALLRDW